jgi:hypothetical protein
MSNNTGVMPALVPGIHIFLAAFQRSKAWMTGTSPAMTPVHIHLISRLSSAIGSSVCGRCGKSRITRQMRSGVAGIST